jgi:hypothetical protein
MCSADPPKVENKEPAPAPPPPKTPKENVYKKKDKGGKDANQTPNTRKKRESDDRKRTGVSDLRISKVNVPKKDDKGTGLNI